MFAELNNWLIPIASISIVEFLIIVFMLIYYRTFKIDVVKRLRAEQKENDILSFSLTTCEIRLNSLNRDNTEIVKLSNEIHQMNFELLEEIDGLKNAETYFKKRLKEKDKEIAESQSQVLTLRENLIKATQEIKDLGNQIHSKNNEILELKSGI